MANTTNHPRIPWTAAEVRILRSSAQSRTPAQIATALDRSQVSVYRKLVRLGLVIPESRARTVKQDQHSEYLVTVDQFATWCADRGLPFRAAMTALLKAAMRSPSPTSPERSS